MIELMSWTIDCDALGIEPSFDYRGDLIICYAQEDLTVYDEETKLVDLNIKIMGDHSPYPNVCYSLINDLLVSTPIFGKLHNKVDVMNCTNEPIFVERGEPIVLIQLLS